MKVLLVSPNRERVPDPVFPLGPAYVASALKKEGHIVSALDLCFEDDIEGAIRDRIESFVPDVVGLSIRNIDDVSYPKSVCYLDHYKEVVNVLRIYCDAPLVLGGAAPTIMPGPFLKELGAEFAVVGEGERAFCDLLDGLRNGKIRGRRIIRSERTPVWKAIIPDRDMFDANLYYEYGGMLNIQTKRGCPFSCIYCSYPAIEGCTVRVRSPESVADELEMVVEKTGVRHFFFVDGIFNYPVEHAEGVCDAIIRRKVDINWTCYGNPAYMTERLAEKMARAGCTSIEFGTDSLIDETLAILKKGFRFSQVREASAVCKRAGIHYCHFIFAGAPGDTMERVKLNIERLHDLGSGVSVVMAGIRIFPNTPLSEIAREELGIDTSSISIKPVYYISPGVIKDIDTIVDYIKSNYPKCILPGFEININERLGLLLRKAGIKGNLWEELIKR